MRLHRCYGSLSVLTRGDKISLSPGAHQNLRVQSHKEEEEESITMRGFVHGPCFCVLAMTLLAMLPPTETKYLSNLHLSDTWILAKWHLSNGLV